MLDNEYIRPPGCEYDILPHPSGKNKAVEVAVMQAHRFAFFFWLKWNNRLGVGQEPPSLVSLDWHEDLVVPEESERRDLLALDKKNYREAAFFCWDKLNPLNDGHILAAAFLNLIGDIFVVRKQSDSSGSSFIDTYGNTHIVRCFDTVADLMANQNLLSKKRVFFDIDLDYFTESPDPCGGGEHLTLVSNADIAQSLGPESGLVPWLLPRLEGMTIAMEPRFCGGFTNSNRLFDAVSEALFDPPLLTKNSGWARGVYQTDVLVGAVITKP